MIPCLTLCRSRIADEVVIIDYALNAEFGYAESFGPLRKLTLQEFERDGLKIVMESLEEFPRRRRTQQSECELLSKRDQLDFDRRHKHVSLSLHGVELWLGPMHFGRRGGMQSLGPKERLVIKLPTTQGVLFGGVIGAFHIAD